MAPSTSFSLLVSTRIVYERTQHVHVPNAASARRSSYYTHLPHRYSGNLTDYHIVLWSNGTPPVPVCLSSSVAYFIDALHRCNTLSLGRVTMSPFTIHCVVLVIVLSSTAVTICFSCGYGFRVVHLLCVPTTISIHPLIFEHRERIITFIPIIINQIQIPPDVRPG